MRYNFNAVFLVQVYLGSQFCHSILETVHLQVPARYIRDLSLFIVCSAIKNCAATISASAGDVTYRDVDVFGTKTVSLNHIL
jgi:hypothetical protein